MKTVFVSGVFNVLHPGHLRLFKFAKEMADHLVVQVIGDKAAASSAKVSEILRLDGVKSISFVNDAYISNDTVSNEIRRLKPNYVVKGKEHELGVNPELNALREYGGKLIFSSGETTFSSYELHLHEGEDENLRSIKLHEDFLRRHEISRESLIKLIHKFRDLTICVVGDSILDEYITCQPLGMSQEDSTIVVTPLESSKYIGGAAIVAGHAKSLGSDVHFISVIGADKSGEFLNLELNKLGIRTYLVDDESRPTTLKQRFRTNGRSIFRVSHLHQTAISKEKQLLFLDQFKEVVNKIDLLIFSDFNYGALPQSLVDQITSLAVKKNIMIAADSQSSSQMGNIGRFKNVNLLTPTENEARISTRNNEDGLVILAEELRVLAKSDNILLKLGVDGVLIHSRAENSKVWETDQIRSMNYAARDVSGAGDSLLVASSMALACGASIWEASFLGSMAAAIQVSRTGNVPIKETELQGLLK
jgi:rfaE bifunctional protein kinase chain/domain